MAKGVFLFREDSVYEDRPWEAYQFPSSYLSRASEFVGDWVIYMEPAKAGPKGYHAVARVEKIVPDPTQAGMFLALIDPTSYLEFDQNVPFQTAKDYPEQSVLNQAGKVSGRAQAAVRPIPISDFNRIIAFGLGDSDALLPRIDDVPQISAVAEDRAPFENQQDRSKILVLRTVRDRVFRKKVLQAYDCRCALTGLKFINGGGRAEVEAAHIKSVEAKGPDVVPNGLALSGTIHWMFDRGLISIADDARILLSNHINDTDGVRKILHRNGFAQFPGNTAHRPSTQFLEWHRTECFKGEPLQFP